MDFEKRPLSKKTVEAALTKDWLDSHRPLTVYGRDTKTKRFTYFFAKDGPPTIDALKFAVDYVDYQGKRLSVVRARTLHKASGQLADLLGRATISTSTLLGDIAPRVEVLASLRAEADLSATLVLVAPPGEPFSGKLMWDALVSIGLRWGDGDLFHWHDSAQDPVFSVDTSTPPGYFFPEEALKGTMRLADLRFSFSIPRTRDPESAYEAMTRAVRYVHKRLGGTLLTSKKFSHEANRERMRTVRRALQEAGLKPGEDTVLMLF